MSVTLSANIDIKSFPEKKVYVDEHYGYDQETCEMYFHDDPYVTKEETTGRYFFMEPDIDFAYEINMSNSNFASVLKNIDNNMYIVSRESDLCGGVKKEDLSSFHSKVMKAINSSNQNGTRDSFQDGNVFHCGIDKEAINQRLNYILQIILTAKKYNVDIYWG
jgi:hypothetical protein